MLRGNVAKDQPAVLRRIFGRFKKEDLPSVLAAAGVQCHLDVSRPKGEVLSALLEAKFRQGISFELLAQVDLIHSQEKTLQRKWTAIQLVPSPGKPMNVLADETALASTWSGHLKVFFEHHLACRRRKDAIWIRLYIHEKASSPTASSNVVYFVYVPRARHILVSSMKVGHREYILQSLLTTLGCAEARELELKGKDADSLLEMVLHQQSMGPFVAYRLGEYDSNPFDIHAKRQKTQEVPQQAGPVVVEDVEAVASRDRVTEESFGHHEQPKLQKIEFKLETRYRGGKYDIDGPFFCRVKFEGTSVIEGIRSLVPLGVASAPLPAHIADLHSTARSSYVLQEPDRNGASPG